MNTNQTHHIRTTTIAAFIAIVACVSTAAPTFAGETHDNGEGGSATTSASPYATPATALDGLTLAQYIQQHQDADPRTAVVV